MHLSENIYIYCEEDLHRIMRAQSILYLGDFEKLPVNFTNHSTSIYNPFIEISLS